MKLLDTEGRVGTVLTCGHEDRTQSQVVNVLVQSAVELFLAVSREPEEGIASEQRSCCGYRKIVLSQVCAVCFCRYCQIDSVVDEKAGLSQPTQLFYLQQLLGKLKMMRLQLQHQLQQQL